MMTQRILYIDVFSGASGDMLLGALLDAGLSFAALQSELEKLNLAGYELEAEHKESQGLSGTQLYVRETLDEHPARHVREIRQLVSDSTVSEWVKNESIGVIERLGRAEARIHGVPLEEVHFHEIGAVDTIVDIVGFCAGLEILGIEQVYASPISLGSGTVDTAHGRLPVPVPATLALLAEVNAPTVPNPARTEIVTPTGAALLSHFAIFERPPMRVLKVGYGFGSKAFPWANGVRVWLGEQEQPAHHKHDQVVVIECNLDDMTGEVLGYAMDRLFEAGALDVWFAPIQMKKNRPAVLLSVLSPLDRVDALSDVLLYETSTLGVRMYPPAHRFKAERSTREVEIPWGRVHVKEKWVDGRRVAVSPEYDDCARLARETGEPLVRIMEAARRAGEA